ncbi:MAG TPA: acetolactate synthase small subunit [Candidatus Merdivicinus intestinavium]|nr:acetolactate synthase small subunit [Candidatus Merdivicinus intestinavium]
MKRTISVLVENRAGVLSRVAGLFARRGFNIESLAVGTTAEPGVSCITIVADDRENVMEQINKQLNKLIDVIKLKEYAPDELISRELMLIKVNANVKTRGEIAELAKLAGGKVCDLTRSSITIEYCDTTDRVENFLELCRPYGLKRVVRTGAAAIEKGAEQLALDE